MKFTNRKLYQHCQNKNVFTLQIPAVVCKDMNLTKDTLMEIDYENGEFKVSKQEQQVEVVDQGPSA